MEDTTTTSLPATQRNTPLLQWVAVGIGVVALVVGWYVYSTYTRPADDVHTLESNQPFVEATELFRAKDVEAARAKYEEALAQANSVHDEARLRLLIAQTVSSEGHYLEA